MTGPYRDAEIRERELVDAVLRDLTEAADRWESALQAAESTKYSVDLGDLRAVTNADGKLIELTLHPNMITEYSHGELTERLNLAFAALRDEAVADHETRFGTELQ